MTASMAEAVFQFKLNVNQSLFNDENDKQL